MRRDQGSSTWRTLARASAAWNGTYRFAAVTVSRNTYFKVQFRGSAGYPGVTTASRAVGVSVKLLNVRSNPKVPVAGSPITVTASTSRLLAGQRVLLQRRMYSTYWENLSAVTVGRSGAITATLRQAEVGRKDYRFELVATASHPRTAASVPGFTVFKWFPLAEYESLYTKTIGGQFHASAPGWELTGPNGTYSEHNISLGGKCREFKSTVGIWDGHADPGLAAQFVLLTPSGARAVSGAVREGSAVKVSADVRGWSRLGMRTVKRAPESVVGTGAWGSPLALCSQEPSYLGYSYGG